MPPPPTVRRRATKGGYACAVRPGTVEWQAPRQHLPRRAPPTSSRPTRESVRAQSFDRMRRVVRGQEEGGCSETVEFVPGLPRRHHGQTARHRLMHHEHQHLGDGRKDKKACARQRFADRAARWGPDRSHPPRRPTPFQNLPIRSGTQDRGLPTPTRPPARACAMVHSALVAPALRKQGLRPRLGRGTSTRGGIRPGWRVALADPGWAVALGDRRGAVLVQISSRDHEGAGEIGCPSVVFLLFSFLKTPIVLAGGKCNFASIVIAAPSAGRRWTRPAPYGVRP